MKKQRPEALSIKQNMLWNSAGSLVNLGCQWLISIFIVRLASDYRAAGVYSLALSISSMLGPIAHFRTYTYQVSDVDDEFKASDYLVFRLMTCFAALLVTALYSIVTVDSSSLVAILLLSVWKLVGFVIDVFHATDQKNHRMDFIGKSLALQGAVSLGLFCLVFGLSDSLELALIAMALGTMTICVAFDYPRARLFADFKQGTNAAKMRSLFLACLPLVVANVAFSAVPSIPRQLLSTLNGASDLGIYASVAAPAAIIQAGAAYIYNPLIGYFSSYKKNGDSRNFVALLSKAMGGVFLIGVAATIVLGLFGDLLLTIMYGADIARYSYLFYLIVPVSILIGVAGFMNDLLMALRFSKEVSISSYLSLIVMAIVSVPLIEQFGLNGVSLACLVSEGVGIAYSAVVIWRKVLRVKTC